MLPFLVVPYYLKIPTPDFNNIEYSNPLNYKKKEMVEGKIPIYLWDWSSSSIQLNQQLLSHCRRNVLHDRGVKAPPNLTFCSMLWIRILNDPQWSAERDVLATENTGTSQLYLWTTTLFVNDNFCVVPGTGIAGKYRYQIYLYEATYMHLEEKGGPQISSADWKSANLRTLC